MPVLCQLCGGRTHRKENLAEQLCQKCNPLAKQNHYQAIKRYRATEKGKAITNAVNNRSKRGVDKAPDEE